ncbi:unnamed protein product [Diatraea saccharalis]|uniref:Serpin domain-containing protein n=1 Tax=Diatraea saccharalis TaxID=40085 RepID=A0A9P0C3W1_9NEOP|nr:unnamed protein product [Diatraea saccharalis]
MKQFIYILAVVAMAMADETSVQKLLADATNHFTAKMFAEVAKENSGKSVVMSGFSAMSPLAQLGLASVGISHDEILEVIGLPNDNATKEVFSYVSQDVRSVKGVELKIANRVFLPEGVALNEEFGVVSRDVFHSDLKQVDFTKNIEAAATINTWVEDNTNKRIKDLVKPSSLGPDTKAVLVNAIYFKGSWKNKFNPEATQDRDFHVTKDKTIQVPTMFKNGNFKFGYSQELDAKLLEIFYEGEEASFLVVLPNEIDGLKALEEKLKDPSALEKATAMMYNSDVDVYLPKFKIETTIDLKSVLSNIGISHLFDPANARLEKLLKNYDDGLYVSDAIQKAFIEVNEEGAEAAAASAFVESIESLSISMPRTFNADRPFYFELRQKSLKMFNGVIVQL